MNIILDTNILRADFLLKSANSQSLINFIKRTESVLVLPRVVVQEITALYNFEIEVRKKNVENSINEFLKLLDGNHLNKDWIGDVKIISDYECYLNSRFRYFLVIPYCNSYLEEIIRRSINRVKPCSSKGEEFRDVLAWLSIVDFLKKNSSDEAAFITNNIKDFAANNGMNLHPLLQNELLVNKINLRFYCSLKDFLNNEASSTDFISRDWIVKHINWKRIEQEVYEAVKTIHCGFFFTLCSRTLNIKTDCNYEIRDIVIDKENTDYEIAEKGNGEFILALGFTGIVSIRFLLPNHKVKTIKTHFWVETTVICSNERVLHYSGEYYEETSGLCLPDPNI